MNLKEKENLFQAIFVVAVVILKRSYGNFLGAYENAGFVFIAAVGLFAIQLILQRLDRSGEPKDAWEAKWDFATIILYGFGLLVLQWLNVSATWILIVVGVLLIGINVIVKYKRREIKKNMDAR